MQRKRSRDDDKGQQSQAAETTESPSKKAKTKAKTEAKTDAATETKESSKKKAAFKEFKIHGLFAPEEKVKNHEHYSRSISEVKKSNGKNDHLWIFKNADHRNRDEDHYHKDIEVVATEFARLIHNVSPKTRLARLGEKSGVASKKVLDYKILQQFEPESIKQAIQADEIIGLGTLTVLALVLGDNDFAIKNLGLTKDKFIINIDGNNCFSRTRKFGKDSRQIYPQITPEDYKSLPNLATKQKTYNWLLQYRSEKNYDDKFPCSKQCENVINYATLFILTLPEEAIKEFVRYYTSSEKNCEKITKDLLQSITELRTAALETERFQKYLFADTTPKVMESITQRVQSFTLTKKDKLTDLVPKLTDKMQEEFSKLKLELWNRFNKKTALAELSLLAAPLSLEVDKDEEQLAAEILAAHISSIS